MSFVTVCLQLLGLFNQVFLLQLQFRPPVVGVPGLHLPGVRVVIDIVLLHLHCLHLFHNGLHLEVSLVLLCLVFEAEAKYWILFEPSGKFSASNLYLGRLTNLSSFGPRGEREYPVPVISRNTSLEFPFPWHYKFPFPFPGKGSFGLEIVREILSLFAVSVLAADGLSGHENE